jgi:imipenem/basic amino acid-specific outer membrane pore
MKKIVKISLMAAITVAGFSTAQADTLAEAFAASKVKGEIKSQYFTKKSDAGVSNNIWTNGGNLSLITGSFNGLVAGVTFQTGHVYNENGGYDSDMNASGSVMSEAYLAYTLSNTTLKAGRQFISTPLIAGSGSRMFRQSFEGFVLTNTDLPNTTLVAAYVDKYQHRTSYSSDSTAEIGNAPTFEQVADGAYSVYAKNTSIENLAIQAQYAQINGENTDADKKVYYADAAYKIGDVTLSGQAFNTDDGTADNNGQLYGLKVEADISGISFKAAYATAGKGQDVLSGLGSGADAVYTAAPIGDGSAYSAEADTYQLGLGYKFDMGLGLKAVHTNWNEVATTKTETDLIVSYAFNKNLSTDLWYSKFAQDSANDYRTRVYVSYKF